MEKGEGCVIIFRGLITISYKVGAWSEVVTGYLQLEFLSCVSFKCRDGAAH